MDQALILLGLTNTILRVPVYLQSSWCYMYLKICYIHYFTERGGIGLNLVD